MLETDGHYNWTPSGARPAHTDAARLPYSAAPSLAHQTPQSGHLPYRDAATAPFDRLTHRRTLAVSHRQQRAAGASLRVPDCLVAFT
jgi:hypothetical protein